MVPSSLKRTSKQVVSPAFAEIRRNFGRDQLGGFLASSASLHPQHPAEREVMVGECVGIESILQSTHTPKAPAFF